MDAPQLSLENSLVLMSCTYRYIITALSLNACLNIMNICDFVHKLWCMIRDLRQILDRTPITAGPYCMGHKWFIRRLLENGYCMVNNSLLAANFLIWNFLKISHISDDVRYQKLGISSREVIVTECKQILSYSFTHYWYVITIYNFVYFLYPT